MEKRRAHECAAGQPVKRDGGHIGVPGESSGPTVANVHKFCKLPGPPRQRIPGKSGETDPRLPPFAITAPAMQRLTHDQPIPEELRGAVIALGNFDGFHLGHQAVVGRAVQRGAHERRPVIVATFDPHPVRHFRPDTPPFRLTTLDQRERLFAHAGADAMLVFHFGAELASRPRAEDFVAELLARRSRRGRRRHRRGLHLRQGPRRQCRGSARAGRNARNRRRDGGAGSARRRADLVGPGPRSAAGRRPGHRDPPADPPVRDRGRWSSMATSAAASSAGRPPTSSSAIISAPPTASMRCA